MDGAIDFRFYTNFKKECHSILVPPLCKGGARGGRRVLHDLRKMVLDRVTESDRTKPERETRFLRKNCDEKREIFVETGFLRSQVDKSYLFNL
ncbi:MAG: hypothetical protein EAZ79_28710 [Oscillatoriales cyanobacterium]|nr:MAG: hypothetical protein EAZ79_28710 [Oscillatoriales cyanobacterium]